MARVSTKASPGGYLSHRPFSPVLEGSPVGSHLPDLSCGLGRLKPVFALWEPTPTMVAIEGKARRLAKGTDKAGTQIQPHQACQRPALRGCQVDQYEQDRG